MACTGNTQGFVENMSEKRQRLVNLARTEKKSNLISITGENS